MSYRCNSVYVWVFAGTTIRDENSTIPSDRDPGYSNGKFDDAPLVIVKNLPVMEGYTFKITPINELSDCGYLSVNIEDYWYNLYYLSDSSQYQYYTNIIIGTKPLTYKVIENVDLSCMCDGDSKFMKNNPFQLTYPPEYEIKYTNNQRI
jgi:hypothetical protein